MKHYNLYLVLGLYLISNAIYAQDRQAKSEVENNLALTEKHDARIAQQKTAFLHTEIQYVSELIQLKEFSFAQDHLDIIKKEFKHRQDLILYYQASISFATEDYAGAIKNYQTLLKLEIIPSDRKSAQRNLFTAYINNNNASDARALLASFKMDGNINSWYAEACLSLAQSLAATLSRKTPEEKVKGKEESIDLLIEFTNKFPKHEKSPWFKYHIAEFKLNELELMLKKLDLYKNDGTPLVRKKKYAIVRDQLFDTLAIYQGLEKTKPDELLTKHSTDRIVQLNKFLIRLNDAEDKR